MATWSRSRGKRGLAPVTISCQVHPFPATGGNLVLPSKSRSANAEYSCLMRQDSQLFSCSSAQLLPATERTALAALKSLRRRTATLSLGRPSCGGQRTVGWHSTATVSGHSMRRAMWRRSCAVWSSSEFWHRRPFHLSAGCPSFGGQRTVRCHSTTTEGGSLIVPPCGAVKRFRVHGFGLYASAPRPHGPNPSFNSDCLRQPS